MKSLHIRQQQVVLDPLSAERLLRALKIIIEHEEVTHASSTLRAGLDDRAKCQTIALSLFLILG